MFQWVAAREKTLQKNLTFSPHQCVAAPMPKWGSSEHVACAQCSDNTKVTLSHIAWHVSQETLHEVADSLEAAAPKCKTCGTPACMCKKNTTKVWAFRQNEFSPEYGIRVLTQGLPQSAKTPK